MYEGKNVSHANDPERTRMNKHEQVCKISLVLKLSAEAALFLEEDIDGAMLVQLDDHQLKVCCAIIYARRYVVRKLRN